MCDWGRTHIAVERKHTEWRDHHTNQMWHQRGTLTHLSLDSARVHCAHLAREESVHWDSPEVGIFHRRGRLRGVALLVCGHPPEPGERLAEEPERSAIIISCDTELTHASKQQEATPPRCQS